MCSTWNVNSPLSSTDAAQLEFLQQIVYCNVTGKKFILEQHPWDDLELRDGLCICFKYGNLWIITRHRLVILIQDHYIAFKRVS